MTPRGRSPRMVAWARDVTTWHGQRWQSQCQPSMQTGKQERGMCEGYVHKATGMALMRRQKTRLGDNTHANTHTHTDTHTHTHTHISPCVIYTRACVHMKRDTHT